MWMYSKGDPCWMELPPVKVCDSTRSRVRVMGVTLFSLCNARLQSSAAEG